jgi:nitrate reductase beta subunit
MPSFLGHFVTADVPLPHTHACARSGKQTVLGYLPTEAEWRTPNIHEDSAAGGKWEKGKFNGSVDLNASAKDPAHRVWFFYLARICNHCTYPGCLGACPRQAIYKRPEDGIVLIDQERCRGYRKCVEGCPYKKVMYRPNTRTSEKCIGCYPRIEGKDPELCPDGAPIETRCMSVCVGKIRLQGLIKIGPDGRWEKRPDNPLYFLIRERQVALPLYPQFGTEPNGFYIRRAGCRAATWSRCSAWRESASTACWPPR